MNKLKQALQTHTQTIGSWITLAHPAIAEIMAKAGFDWLVVDLEHSVITIREAEELIRVIDLCGLSPLIRLTSNDSNQIKRVMDAGAHGVIVPMVNSREEALQIIRSVYYPPRGQRGVGLARAQGYGTTFSNYKKWMENDGPVVIVQIEHIDAVNHLEDIFSVEGIDGYIIGPYDLSASMGMPGELDHPKVQAAIEKVRKTAEKMQKPGGIHIVEPDPLQLKNAIHTGFTFIAYSLDMRMLENSCRVGLLEVNKNECRRNHSCADVV